MKNRIREIRKAHKLTQTEFGERIGVKGNTVTGYETGLRIPSDAIIRSISREFGVNEEWFRTGKGKKDCITTFSLDELVRECGVDDADREAVTNLVRVYFSLRADTRREIMARFSEMFSKNPVKVSAKNPHDMNLEEMQEEVARQYAEEKEATAESSDSGSGNCGSAIA